MSTYIDLFSGIGGFALALQDISQPRLYCDIEQSSQKVLIKHIKNESLPPAPVIYDVKDVRKAVMPHLQFQMIASGFPCNGFSAAGQRKGFMNEHSSLFLRAAANHQRVRAKAGVHGKHSTDRGIRGYARDRRGVRQACVRSGLDCAAGILRRCSSRKVQMVLLGLEKRVQTHMENTVQREFRVVEGTSGDRSYGQDKK